MNPQELKDKRVKLIRMEDPYNIKLKSGDEGTIKGVDGAGQILVKWDCGSTLSLLPNIDEYEIIESRVFSFSKFVFENYGYQSQFDSSIESDEANRIIYQCQKIQNKLDFSDTDKLNKLIHLCKERISNYDKITIDFVIDRIFIDDSADEFADELISLGDIIMDRFGTEPREVINAFEDCFSVLVRYVDIYEEEEDILEKKKSKIPRKYLTKNKKAMKKEIEKYKGKDEYKTEWDADYKSGKGGEGGRWSTKKSSATKAYHKKYGKNNEVFKFI